MSSSLYDSVRAHITARRARSDHKTALREAASKRMKPDIKAIYDSPQMKQLVKAFNQLPKAKTKEDEKRTSYFWTLQYPFAHHTSDPRNTEDMEFVLHGRHLLNPIVVPCKRSLLQMEDCTLSPYVIGLFCQAFVGETGKKLLEWDLANLEEHRPETYLDAGYLFKHGQLSEADKERISREKASILPAGYFTHDAHLLMRKREGVPPSKLPVAKVIRPTSIYCRDMRLIRALLLQTALLGIEMDVLPTDARDYSAFFVPSDIPGGKVSPRKDVAFCETAGCTALSDTHLRCSYCKLSSYCSNKHRKQDWPKHKSRCWNTERFFKGQKEGRCELDFGDNLRLSMGLESTRQGTQRWSKVKSFYVWLVIMVVLVCLASLARP